MKAKTLFSMLALVVGVGLVVAAGQMFLADRLSGVSPVEVTFADPDSLEELKSMSTNRLKLQVHNTASTAARIVGTDAC